MILKFKILIYNILFGKLKIWNLLQFRRLVKSQIQDPNTIPIIILNFNQLFYLKKLVDFLIKRKFEKIIIIDNASTYPPLLKYYKSLQGVTVEYMDQNYGHMVFFEKKELQKKYGRGYYVVTDADIVPNEMLPADFMKQLLQILRKESHKVTKVGFALDITSIPDYYVHKTTVQNWESKFWTTKYAGQDNSYIAPLDTTFSLYKRGFINNCTLLEFYSAIRIAGNYTALHGGWYIDRNNLTAEQKYYINTASAASSWKIDLNGKLEKTYENKYLSSM